MNDEKRDKSESLQQYDALADKFSEIYLSGKKRGREAMVSALDKAMEELVALKQFSKKQGEELQGYLKRDLDQIIMHTRKLGDEAKHHLNPSSIEAGALASIASVLELAGNTMLKLGHKARDTITCKTGEITSAGNLVCNACEKKIHMEKTGHIPPCPKCRGTLFTKSF